MGLSTKQAASGDHHGIITDLDSQITPSSTRSASSSDDIPTPPPPSVQPHKPPPLQDRQPLKCPRCSSTKTKFCYYNNYNKAQPRHFCKGCKRHWTEGGTLRNVPVGGTRKNNHNNNSKRRRVKTPNDNAAVAIGDQDLLPVFPSLPSDDGCNNFAASFDNLGPSVPPFSLPSCFGYFDPATCCSVPTTNKNAYSDMIIGEFDNAEESTISAAMPFTSSDDTIFPAQQQPWKEQEAMDMATFWSLSDIDSLVSVDLNTAWDDDFLDIKPNGK